MVADPGRPAFVFDLGAVLIDWNPRYLYRKLFDDESEMEYFLTEVCSPAWNVRQDAGRPFAEAIAELNRSYPQYRAMINAWLERWEEMIPSPIHGTVDILLQLHGQGEYLCALSNWSAETFPFARKRYDFFDCFSQIVLSGAEKCAKPDPRIYRILLERIQRNAGDCLFIDDSLANIEAARQLGFQTIHFQSPELLRQRLLELGLLA